LYYRGRDVLHVIIIVTEAKLTGFYQVNRSGELIIQEVLVETTLPIEVFLSYAHEDRNLAQELERHLSLLKRQGLIDCWFDAEIIPGTEWLAEINHHLNTAQIILLLVSPDFMASDFVFSIEMKHALERHLAGEARVIPLILRPTEWQNTPFGSLKALPRDGKPMTRWSSRDLAFLDVTKGIRQTIEEMVYNPPASLRSVVMDQAPAYLDPTKSFRFEELANDLRRSYSYIKGYEDILRVADDPREKAQAQQSIKRQSILTSYYLKEYQELARQLGVRMAPDIAQIQSYVGGSETRAVS
jgi:hypothetical protein